MAQSMEDVIKLPSLDWGGDPAGEWTKFKARFENYLEAIDASAFKESRKCAILKCCLGEKALDILNSFSKEFVTVSSILKALDEHFLPKKNLIFERYKFFICNQEADEDISEYLTRLRHKAASCEFQKLRDDLILSRFIAGLKNCSLKEKLLDEPKLTLDMAFDRCRVIQLAKQRASEMTSEAEVDMVGRKHPPSKNVEPSAAASQSGYRGQYYPRRWSCTRCGYNHPAQGNCPARGKECLICKRIGHFSKCCYMRNKGQKVDNVEEGALPDDSLMLGSVEREINCLKSEWVVDFKILDCGKKLCFKLDTGAQMNVIPNNVFTQLGIDDKLRSTKVTASTYGGERLCVVGACDLRILVGKDIYTEEFVIIRTKRNSGPILGIYTIQKLNLLSRKQNFVDEICSQIDFFKVYSDVFNGLGKINCSPVNFKLKANYESEITPCRHIPFALMSPLKLELERMVSEGVICSISEPTEFVNPLVLVKKPTGAIRLCLDPQKLNAALVREYYQLPTFEEITKDMVGAKFFSTLDAYKGFWQIELDETASRLTTFATPFGRYRFRRLPFGVAVSSEIFHKVFVEIFGDIENVKVYIDDIIIFSESKEQHNKILTKVFDRARKMGVSFNKEKCKIGVQEVRYVGHVLSAEGIKPDSDRIEAINQIESPKNAKELQRFLGMATYVSKFIPNFSNKTSELRKLNKKDIVWLWTAKHEAEFQALKLALSNFPVLQFYNDKEPITLSVDSSKDGMGAVILQKGQPVAYASKSLTETQQRYAQIEKEMLAILFGCQRFHQYLYGRNFSVETDHKPLESIFKKPLNKCPMRLQRLRISLQNYTFTVRYKRGSQLYIADALSRSSYDDKNFKINEFEIEAQVNLIESGEMSSNKFKLLIGHTKEDSELQELLKVIKMGWPENKNQLVDCVRPYWNFKGELVEQKGAIFKGNQIVIPKVMRSEILNRLHYDHLGIEKTKLRANDLVFWPFMNKEIEDKISNCRTCLTFSNSNRREPLVQRQQPARPWQFVAADLFYYQGQNYLLIVDCFSKFPELINLKQNTRYQHIIETFKSIFSRHGIPEVLYSDNGPQFSNNFFKEFLRAWDINHKTSSPAYPQSNGFIERHVQTIKKIISKAIFDKRDIYISLLEYRCTPLDANTPSPAQLLYSRQLRTNLPISGNLLHPKIYKKPNRSNAEIENYYNKSARSLRPLDVGNHVMIQLSQGGKWGAGRVVKIDPNRPRAYVVRLDSSGQEYTRNRRFLKWYSPGYERNSHTESGSTPSRDDLGDSGVNESNDSQPGPAGESGEDEVRSQSSQPYRTRSGRQVCKPKYFLN